LGLLLRLFLGLGLGLEVLPKVLKLGLSIGIVLGKGFLNQGDKESSPGSIGDSLLQGAIQEFLHLLEEGGWDCEEMADSVGCGVVFHWELVSYLGTQELRGQL